MKRKFVLVIVIVTFMLLGIFSFLPAKSQPPLQIITPRADGSVDPPTALITRTGDTYRLTGSTFGFW